MAAANSTEEVESAGAAAAPRGSGAGPAPASLAGGDTAVAVTALHKHYRVFKRPPGLYAAMRSLWHREYEDKQAVRGITFRIAAGERVGFLGPNGAGKTTTLKMLAGLLHPTSGRVEVVGHTPQHRAVDFLKRITLVMGQKQQLIWDLPPADTFELNRAVYDIPNKQYQEMLGELTELLELSQIMKTPTRQLSLGERMKCELVAALLHRPQVLFLDEPTIGLDVSMQVALRQFIRLYNERYAATVLLTSHYMEDVLALCPRVLVINQGELRYDGELTALVHQLRPEKRVTVRLSAPAAGTDAPSGNTPVRPPINPEQLQRLGKLVSSSPTELVLQIAQGELRAAVAHLIGNLPIADLTVEDPPLQEVMRDLFALPRPVGSGKDSP